MSLKHQTFHSVLWMAAGNTSQQVLSFLLFIILARTLDPIAFGVVGIAIAFIDIFNFIGRAGLSEVMVQKKSLTATDKDTIFWSSLAVGALLSVVLFAAAGPLARLFATPDLEFTLQLLAPSCLIFAAGTAYEGLLRHAFGFKALATRNVTSTLVSGAVGVAMALSGYGLLSLIVQRLISASWLTLSMVYATKWVPGLQFNWALCKADLAKGAPLAAASILGAGNQRIIDLIVGYILGPVALGYLRIAWRGLDMLLELTIRPISGVLLTSLAKLQENPAALRKAYIQLIQLTALVLYPLFLGVGMVAPFFITTVFGTTWQASAPLLQMLTLMAFGVPLIWFKSNILIANNKMRQVLEINLIEFTASLGFALAMTPWGVEASALGNTLRILLTAPIILWLIQRHTGTSAMQTLCAVVPPAVAASVMVAVLALLRTLLMGDLGDGLVLNLMLMACGAVVYPAALYLIFPQFCKQTFQMLVPVFKKIR